MHFPYQQLFFILSQPLTFTFNLSMFAQACGERVYVLVVFWQAVVWGNYPRPWDLLAASWGTASSLPRLGWVTKCDGTTWLCYHSGVSRQVVYYLDEVSIMLCSVIIVVVVVVDNIRLTNWLALFVCFFNNFHSFIPSLFLSLLFLKEPPKTKYLGWTTLKNPWTRSERKSNQRLGGLLRFGCRIPNQRIACIVTISLGCLIEDIIAVTGTQ